MRGAFLGSPGGGGSRAYYNSWYHGPGFSVGLPLVVCSAHFSKWVLLLCKAIQYVYKSNYNIRGIPRSLVCYGTKVH